MTDFMQWAVIGVQILLYHDKIENAVTYLCYIGKYIFFERQMTNLMSDTNLTVTTHRQIRPNFAWNIITNAVSLNIKFPREIQHTGP